MQREYVESVRKKSFLFGLVATPLTMLAMIYLPLLTGGMLASKQLVFAVLDETGRYGEALREAIGGEDSRGPGGGPRPQVHLYGPGEGPSPEELDGAVLEGELTGWILLPAEFETEGLFEYHAETVTNLEVLGGLQKQIERLLAEKRAAEFGLAAEQVDVLLQPARMKTFRVGHGGVEEADFTRIYLHAVALVMILFFALVPTGQILMRSVIEEKSNRVIEVLLASLTPKELMVGKILGLGAVGLTMIGAWSLCGLALAVVSGAGFPIGAGEAGIFVLYFLPGYFLYAARLGTVGAVCNSEREAQPFLTPISLVLVFPVMLGVAIAQNPNHLLARVLSFVPPFTPSLMLFRYTIQRPPAWEIGATWLLLCLSTVAMFAAASRVFRTGILLYGKRPTLPEIARWVAAR